MQGICFCGYPPESLAIDLHQRPGDDARPSIVEKLPIPILSEPGIELDAHEKVIYCRTYARNQLEAPTGDNVSLTAEFTIPRMGWGQVRFDIGEHS